MPRQCRYHESIDQSKRAVLTRTSSITGRAGRRPIRPRQGPLIGSGPTATDPPSSGFAPRGQATTPPGLPQHFLCFLPLPHGHGSLGPTLGALCLNGRGFTSMPSTKRQLPSSLRKLATS